LFVESYRTGDVEGALPYVDADISIPFLVGDLTTWMPGLIEFQGALYGRDEPGPSVCEGPDESGWVSCTFTEAADGVLAAAGFPETTWQGKVADGRIVAFHFSGTESTALNSFEIPLGKYAAEIDPEGMAAQCDIARALQTGELTSPPVVYNQQCGAFLAGFLDDYQASVVLLSGGDELDVVNEAPVSTTVVRGQEAAASLIGTHGRVTGGLASSRPDLLHFNLDGTFQVELDGDIIDSGTYKTEGDLISFVSQPSEPVWQYNPCMGPGGDCIRGTHNCESFAGEYRVVFEGTTQFTFEVVHDECPPRIAVARGLEMELLTG